MLRIHFSAEDLRRTCVARSADPLWEMVFSRLRLRERDKALVFLPWARRVRHDIADPAIASGLRVLTVLSPLGPYFPDFLTPPEGALGLVPAVEAIRATPSGRIRHELHLLSQTARLPSWTRSLAEGDRELLGDIGHSLIDYYRNAIEPYTDTIEAAVDMDCAYRARTMLDSGVDGLLHGMRPLMQWQPPVLKVQYDVHRDLHLRGRGLRFVPSYFCRRVPVALADPDLPPTLVYPVNHDYAGKRQVDATVTAFPGGLYQRCWEVRASLCSPRSEKARRPLSSPSG
ncbi:hypothetical protein JOF56_008201 [Kibdelosporangium banguiense]|uniref:Transcriptional regulator n=1 Tax=Kibdelosporangium banguiense TaxID=1365924 RepID=A0ABS4TTT4_9PSEU|nr:ArsR family transcriptional regulator [Kibdelosporangium banguiense]MBP2327816.1 hypothetical protein [Kibdelosporangium banguiense]